ncbi:MAG: flagellar hook-length control protein FliK [Terriglobia bacterium]
MSGGSGASPSANGDQATPAASGHPFTGPRLSWFMGMIQDVLTGQKPPTGVNDLSSSGQAGQNGSGKPLDTALAKAAASDAKPPDAVKALTNLPAYGSGSQPANAASNPASNSTSAAGTTSSPTVKRNAATVSAQDGTEMQNAAQFLESAGLTLLSKTTSADGGALPTVFQAKDNQAALAVTSHAATNAASASAIVHPPPATGTASQVSAKDLAMGNVGAAPAVNTHAAASPAVKPAAASTGGGSKNGASQDSSGKPANSPQTSAAANAAAPGGVASAASNAVQAAASGFPSALSQASAAGNSLAHAGVPAQAAAPQPSVGDKVAAAMDSPVNALGPTVNAASLLQTQGRSEMRVAVQTDNMGTLQLHAVLEGGRVGASISVVSHEAHTLLNNELPALQQVLTDQNLRVDHLTVINSPMSSGTGAGDSRNPQSGNFNHPQGRDTRWYSPLPVAASGAGETLMTADIRRRLSVRA